MTLYTCQSCKAPAAVLNGVVQRSCACTAPVVAHLKAVATGQGGVK